LLGSGSCLCPGAGRSREQGQKASPHRRMGRGWTLLCAGVCESSHDMVYIMAKSARQVGHMRLAVGGHRMPANCLTCISGLSSRPRPRDEQERERTSKQCLKQHDSSTAGSPWRPSVQLSCPATSSHSCQGALRLGHQAPARLLS